MNIKRVTTQTKDFNIPCIFIEPDESSGLVIIIHGYGGTKEEQLGLGWRIANSGFTVCLIDLPGHGESTDYFEGDIKQYIDSLIVHHKDKGRIAAIGHSIGGRLALTSSADYVIGLSPTLVRDFSDETKGFTKNIRSYRVCERGNDFLWELHRQLPMFDITGKENALIIYGSRDLPEITTSCKKMKENSERVFEIDKALHSDVFLNDETYSIIIEQLKKWMCE
ncbi:MAG: alpha/beta fold hydrolase [Ignavibacteria bacterium]|nr:alpha/beta fold hydrolase [Ignavibacteria bacterium]